MKIIRHGKIPQEKECQSECHNCKTLFSLTIAEGELVYDQRDGDYIKTNCPLCSTVICINKDKFR